MDALLQNAAQFLIAFDDENIFRTILFGGDTGSQSAGAAPIMTTSYLSLSAIVRLHFFGLAEKIFRAGAFFGDLSRRYTQFPGEDIHHPRHVEGTQAAAGSQPGAAFDGVIGDSRDGRMDLVDDLPFGHRLAAADDAGVAWIRFDQFDLFLARKFAEMRARGADGIPIPLFV